MSRSLLLRALPSLLFLALAPALRGQDAAAESAETPDAEEPQEEEKEPEGRPPLDIGKPSLPAKWTEGLRWRSIGPANMGGRITDVAVNPDDRCEYWVASAGGGLLHTTNNGVDYEHQFDSERTNSIGCVAVAPSEPTTLWIGTGECNPRNSVSWGDGVYKSTDSGATWMHMGLTEGFQTGGIAIHPTDPNTVYVGVLGRLWGPSEQRGLFKTTDGGETWEKVLFVDDLTGVIDVKMDPSEPEHLLVATYERQRDLHDTNDPKKKWGAGSGLHETRDGGKTFQKLTEGLPTVMLGRIGIDFYAGDSKIVYAVIETEKITQEPENAAYMGVSCGDAEVGARVLEVTEESPAAEAGLQKDDIVVRVGDKTVIDWAALQKKIRTSLSGETIALEVVRDGEVVELECTFGTRPEDEEDADATDSLGYPRAGRHSIGLGGQRQNVQDEQGPEGDNYGGIYRSDDGGTSWVRVNSLNPRPMYYSEIRIDPSNVDNVYVLGTSLYRSKDGGVTFTSDGGRGIHVDHHALWVDPTDGRHMILGNDGGIHVTWDRMDSWDHHNHVAIGQFYNVGVDATRDYKVYGGLQDNGSWGGPNRIAGGSLNSDWFRVGGGDGFVCLVDETDPDLIYYESQNGGMRRSNLRTGEGGGFRPRAPRGTRYRFNWNTPFMLSHHNSRIYYSAGNFVFRSFDKGTGLKRISPEITPTDRGSATAIGESPIDPDVLYAGTDDGGLWTTRDGGKEWIDLWTLNGEPEEEKPEPKDVAAAAEPAADEKEPARGPNAEDVAPGDHPLVGAWKAKAVGEGIESDDEGHFSLEFEEAKDGKLEGTIDAEIGSGALSKIRWDAETKKVTFTFPGEALTLDFDGTVDGETMSGDISGAGGAFTFEFSAKRESAAAADVVADAATEQDPPDEEEATEEDDSGEKKKPKKRKFKKDTIDQLMPGRRYVSNVVPSRYKESRVYVTFDGHRSNDLVPHVYMSDDGGESWTSLRGNLPDEAGSARAFAEDIENRDVLYLGTEFGAWVSVDTGASWTPMGSNLPTVAVHDFAQHPTSGELIAGTHGRSIWIVDVTPLRQTSTDTIDADAHLHKPNTVVRWRRGSSRGQGTRRFAGENPATGAQIVYSLGKKARSVGLSIEKSDGEKVYTFTDPPKGKGMHFLSWNLRASRQGGEPGQRRRRSFRLAAPGTYVAVLGVDGEEMRTEFEVVNDPNQADSRWITYEEEWLESFEVEEDDDTARKRDF
ncbi:MAG: PDZ domain-containing protein [bacterium]|nr:PDZ domain-containing protein [bacterium]